MQYYIIDIRWLYKPFKERVLSYTVPENVYSSNTTQNEWSKWLSDVDFAWTETIMEIFSVMDKDAFKFFQRIEDSVYVGRHIHLLSPASSEIIAKHTELFKETAFQIYNYIKDIAPLENEHEDYFLVTVNNDHAIVGKYNILTD